MPTHSRHSPPPHGADLSIRGVGHRYGRGREPALLDIDLEVAPGDVVALVGRSGSGKSTLLHILAGLIRPSAGAVFVGGERVSGPSPSRVVMFQEPSLLPWMSVAQNVGLGLAFAGRGAEARARVADLLSLVALENLADRNVQDLSGGQQQRVALARSLAVEPALLMLDEPFSALDAFTRAALQRDVRAIARRLGTTLVLVTHDIAEAALMADRAIVLASGPGRIAADLALDLPEARALGDPAVAAAIARIRRSFEAVAAGERAAPLPAPVPRPLAGLARAH
ncbi:ABC transporter ATP-binding protein [Salinarimonas sp.]|uniref:ABC transporter ATP-binding protein n=1 Tax=Salinarimonas sp. TaxID=2766526 RepID=UPI00391DBDBD